MLDEPPCDTISVPKTKALPSGAQLGSASFDWPFVNSWTAPPSDETRQIFHDSPGGRPMKAISLPSGDQRGKPACIGENVSCRRSLPSSLLRHSVPSGTAVYAAHCSSFEKVTPSAEIPERKGRYCRVFAS